MSREKHSARGGRKPGGVWDTHSQGIIWSRKKGERERERRGREDRKLMD